MALTLVEASKLAANAGNMFLSGVIEQYARSSDLLRVLPFMDIAGNALQYNREETLPGVAFRGVNEGFTESTGIVNPLVEPLLLAGGDLDVDNFILKTQGEAARSVHEVMKIKSLAHYFTWAVVKGDNATDPRVLAGLQSRVTGNQLVAAGATSGGDVLSLVKLDEAIDHTMNPTHILMNKAMRRRLSAAARSTTVGGFINYGVDEFGRRITQYGDLPIIVAEEDNAGNQILPFTETGSGGGTAQCTSVYVLSLGDGMLTGIQSGPMQARDLGELQTKPVMRTRVEWYPGIAALHGKSVTRLYGIKDGAVVA